MDGSIRLQQYDDHCLITIRGFLDQELAHHLMGQSQKAQPPIILDFKQVSYISPSGSQAVMSIYQRHHQKPSIRHANEDVISFLELSGVAHYVDWLTPTDTNLTVQE